MWRLHLHPPSSLNVAAPPWPARTTFLGFQLILYAMDYRPNRRYKPSAIDSKPINLPPSALISSITFIALYDLSLDQDLSRSALILQHLSLHHQALHLLTHIGVITGTPLAIATLATLTCRKAGTIDSTKSLSAILLSLSLCY